MCLFSQPKVSDPVLPPEYAQQKQPDDSTVAKSAGATAAERARAGAQTVLTSGSGVTKAAPTQAKTLLGQ